MASTLYSPSKLAKWTFTVTTGGRVRCALYERDDAHAEEWGWVRAQFRSRANTDLLYNAKLAEGWTTC